MDDQRIDIEDKIDDRVLSQIVEILSCESQRSGRTYSPIGLTLSIKIGETLIAGLTGKSFWEWLYIETLAVDPSHQRKGLGRRLVEAAESTALERGCQGVWVDTFTFQSPTFYESLGYEQFAELSDYPKQHSRVFFRKLLK